MKILEIPKTITLQFGEKPDGSPALERVYPFAQYLKDAVTNPNSGFGAWDKQEVGLALLAKINDALKKGDKALEIVLEDAHYQALFDAMKVNPFTAEAGIQTVAGGYRKALETPKKGKAAE